ncbi:multiple sugar transport system permease protein [Kribbella sp. VKM Ac-2571]|uniref:carbohydrate ABC transporter permease n=1 Tax=Kribbella sp. VKM Ac-2571 TaxID=2512222 RepID=UPI00105BA199|nr:carbohydrate ABC transporter permease [Kribbella sp. VKM Ac-2571]TDO55074.1 multiple sugar transport system permease protein [Kribbella sp. VKM Ac-2571]
MTTTSPITGAGPGASDPAATEPGGPARRRRAYSRTRVGPLTYVAMTVISLIFILPLLWMLLTTFKTESDARSIPIRVMPSEWTLRAYRLIFDDAANPVYTWLINSLVVSVLHMVLNVVVAAMAAYALSRMTFRGRNLLFGTLIATLFMPGFIFFMPNYLTMSKLGWLDSYWALVVPGAAGAFGVFFLRQFFLAIPRELEESALIDGANSWTIFTRIMLPLSKPALVTLAVLSFLGAWNDFVWPVFVLFSPDRMTLAPGLATLYGAYTTDYPVVMAGATLAAIPVLILYVVVQRYVIEGVANSGLKG